MVLSIPTLVLVEIRLVLVVSVGHNHLGVGPNAILANRVPSPVETLDHRLEWSLPDLKDAA